MNNSEICQFYNGKHIFLTGPSGLLGKVVLEKLLRVCSPEVVYVLLRVKKNKPPQERIIELLQSPAFDRLRTDFPDFQTKIRLVCGDVSLPNLGLSESDRQLLIDNVDIVIHGAATVRFDENLVHTARINVYGTLSLVKLCHEIKNLQVVIFISTAYSNCPEKLIEEKIYDPPIAPDDLLKFVECIDEKSLTVLSPRLLKDWPNTYTFTKAVSENVVKTYGKGLPIAILRPSIIVSSKTEPFPGWIDTPLGAVGVLFGVAAGVLRVLNSDTKCNIDIVPLDMTVNCLLAVGYKTQVSRNSEEIPIYNFTSHRDNMITYEMFTNIFVECKKYYPIKQAVWYVSYTPIKNKTLYFICSVLLHFLPALLVDVGLRLFRKEPKGVKLYTKIANHTQSLTFVTLASWVFINENVLSLWRSLSSEDKQLFDFDMAALEWPSFLNNLAHAGRIFLFKETPDSIPEAKRRETKLHILHRTTQAVLLLLLFWLCGFF